MASFRGLAFLAVGQGEEPLLERHVQRADGPLLLLLLLQHVDRSSMRQTVARTALGVVFAVYPS